MSSLYDFFKHSSLFKDSFWAVFGNVVGKGMSLIAGIVVARLLGSEIYGEYSIIKSTLITIALFSSFGLGITATKFMAQVNTNDVRRLNSIQRSCTIITLFTSLSLAFLVIIFVKPISAFLEAPHLAAAIRWAAIAIVFNSINTTQIGVLGGLKAYKKIARNNIITGIITFTITIPFTLLFDFNGAVFALVISLAINCLINRISIRKIIPPIYNTIEWVELKNIILFSLPIALQESLYSITSWLISWVIIIAAGYSELGISNAASQWMSIIVFIPGSLRNVALSHLSTTEDNINNSRNLLKNLLLINLITTIIPATVVFFLSNFICSLYGPQFLGLKPVLNIMSFTAIIVSLSNIITQELIVKGKNWFLFNSKLIRDVGIVALSYYMIFLTSGGAFVYACVSLLFQILYLAIISLKLNYVNH